MTPDITMCKHHTCLQKDNCYRYQAEQSHLQPYFLEIPSFDEKGECIRFLKMKSMEEIIEERKKNKVEIMKSYFGSLSNATNDTAEQLKEERRKKYE